jgi:hypothetical protein
MEALSWAIPIDTFQQLVNHLKAWLFLFFATVRIICLLG